MWAKDDTLKILLGALVAEGVQLLDSGEYVRA
jgi:hypothetical protein